MKYALIILAAIYLMVNLPRVFGAEPAKLAPEKALKIANLEAKRNARAAEFQAAILQAERSQKAVQEADAAYQTAVTAEREAAKLAPECQLLDNETWKCPEKKAEPKK